MHSVTHILLPPASPQSVTISSSRLTFVSSPLHLGYFYLAQLMLPLNALFSFCLFSLSVAAFSLFAAFIGVTLAGAQNSQLLLILSPLVPLFLSFSLSSLSAAIYLPSSSEPPLLTLSLSGLQLKYYKCYCILAGGQISTVINQ